MEANKYVDKMVLLPVQRYEQLMNLEKDGHGDSKVEMDKTEAEDDPIDLIPPGIPETELSEVDEAVPEIKTTKKQKQRPRQDRKQKKRITVLWQKLPVKSKTKTKTKIKKRQ